LPWWGGGGASPRYSHNGCAIPGKEIVICDKLIIVTFCEVIHFSQSQKRMVFICRVSNLNGSDNVSVCKISVGVNMFCCINTKLLQ